MDLPASPSFRLDGKRALVTGSTRGIGRAIARAMGLAGARVIVSSEDEAGCGQVAAGLRREGIEVVGLPCDVADDGQLDALARDAAHVWDGIDILVCNAGVNLHTGPSPTTSDEAYERTMRINLRSAFRLTNALVPAMAERRDGVVIIMSSLAGLRGNTALGVYALSKSANAQLARNIAVEWGPHNVRANAISPGLIDTDFSGSFKADADRYERRILRTPMRRMGTAQEVAGCAVFLASPAGAFVTGHNLVCDGGTLAAD